jgi:hypothetical protein
MEDAFGVPHFSRLRFITSRIALYKKVTLTTQKRKALIHFPICFLSVGSANCTGSIFFTIPLHKHEC